MLRAQARHVVPGVVGPIELVLDAPTGRFYGLLTEYKTEDADTVFVSLGCESMDRGRLVEAVRASARPRPALSDPDAALPPREAGR